MGGPIPGGHCCCEVCALVLRVLLLLLLLLLLLHTSHARLSKGIPTGYTVCSCCPRTAAQCPPQCHGCGLCLPPSSPARHFPRHLLLRFHCHCREGKVNAEDAGLLPCAYAPQPRPHGCKGPHAHCALCACLPPPHLPPHPQPPTQGIQPSIPLLHSLQPPPRPTHGVEAQRQQAVRGSQVRGLKGAPHGARLPTAQGAHGGVQREPWHLPRPPPHAQHRCPVLQRKAELPAGRRKVRHAKVQVAPR